MNDENTSCGSVEGLWGRRREVSVDVLLAMWRCTSSPMAASALSVSAMGRALNVRGSAFGEEDSAVSLPAPACMSAAGKGGIRDG